jgi:phosphatidylinositol alpha-1,6-mannosyltransferase
MSKRLIFMTTEFLPGPGGIAMHAYQLAKGLQQRGWDVCVLSTQDDATDEEIRTFNAAQPFKVVRLRRWSNALLEGLYRFYTLIYWYIRWRPALGMASGERAVWLMAALAWFTRLKWMAIGIGTEFTVPIKWARSLTARAFNSASEIVAISDYTRRQMTAIRIQARPIEVIPCGADDELYRILTVEAAADFRRRFNLGAARIILTVGRISDRKGQEIVIRAMPHLLQCGLDVHYVMIGVPERGSYMQALIEQLNLSERVHLLGRQPDDVTVAACNACDVFVMTSRHVQSGSFEGYGIAVVEAALCGKPAVVSDQSGLTEAAAPGETALVVPVDDPEATAGAIASLLTDRQLYERMAKKALQRAQREQTWNQRVEETHRALLKMLGLQP